MLVFLQLHAAVVDALDAAEASHLLIDAQILQIIVRQEDQYQKLLNVGKSRITMYKKHMHARACVLTCREPSVTTLMSFPNGLF